MFSVADRDRIRAELLAAADADPDVLGAAWVGSAARGAQDRWSDIDMVLGLREAADEPGAVARWTGLVADRFGLSDVHDVWAAGVRYRVLLLPSSLQIDLSFAFPDRFRATGEPFTLLFGTASPPQGPDALDPASLIGGAWLRALHVRSALARGRTVQALVMLDGLFDHVVALLCLQHGLSPWHGRGADLLPAATVDALLHCRPTRVDEDGLRGSFAATLRLLLEAVAHTDPARAQTLRRPLDILLGLDEA